MGLNSAEPLADCISVFPSSLTIFSPPLLWHFTKSIGSVTIMNSYKHYILIDQNIKTPAIYCVGLPNAIRTALIPSRHRLQKTSEGVLWSLKSCRLWGGALHGMNLFIQNTPQMLDWIKIWLWRSSQHLFWRATLCHVPQAITEHSLHCGQVHYPAERGHCH